MKSRDEHSIRSDPGVPARKPAARTPPDREVPVGLVGHQVDAFPTPASVPAVEAPARRAALEDIRSRVARGDTAGALTRLDKLVADDADDVALLCERATLFATLSRFDRADADLRRAAKIDEQNPRVFLALGLVACKRARWRDAVPLLRAAIAAAPDTMLAHYYLGEACNHVDELISALSAYERAAELDPANWRALHGIGVVLDRLGRAEEASEAHRRARDVRARD
jgi:Flp pilus assembly protein TadD